MMLVPAPAPVEEPAVELPVEKVSRQTLYASFEAVEDPRCARGTRFPLPAILCLVVVASLCGCQNPSQMHVFAKCRPRLMRRLGFRPPRKPRDKAKRGTVYTPNEDTISNVLKSLDPEQLVQAFAGWIKAMMGRREIAAVDGKALRATGEHVLTVFIGRLSLPVWQTGVRTKENELSALEKVLADLLAEFPGLRLLTGDAMFCQKSIARIVVEARRHYLLQLKAPHTTDLDIAQRAFGQLTVGTAPDAVSEVEKRGGRAAPCW